MLYHFKEFRILIGFFNCSYALWAALVKEANMLFGYLKKAMEGNIENIILILLYIF